MYIASKKLVLHYAPLALLVAGLAGCAPARMPEPIYAGPPPQAMPLTPMPEPMPMPPQVQVQAPIQKPQRFDPPPKVTPIEARTKIVAEPLPEPKQERKPSGPAVSYIPEKQSAPSQQTQSSSVTQTKPADVPFWDQGKVQVEVLDMPKDQNSSTSTSMTVPPQTGLGTTQSSTSTSSTTASTTQSSSSPVVAVLLKQANNELSVGKADRAATTLERALRIAPNDANLWLRLAEVNEQMGNKSQAASMARKALDLSPDDATRLRAQRLAN